MLTLLVIALIGVGHKQLSNHLSRSDMAMNLMTSILIGGLMLMIVGGFSIPAIIVYSITYWTSDRIVAWVKTLIK